MPGEAESIGGRLAQAESAAHDRSPYCPLEHGRRTRPDSARAESRAARAPAPPAAPSALGPAGGRAPLRAAGTVLALAVHRALVARRGVQEGTANAGAGAEARRALVAVPHHAAHHERARLPVLRGRVASCGPGTDAGTRHGQGGRSVARRDLARDEATDHNRGARGPQRRRDGRLSLARPRTRPAAPRPSERHVALLRRAAAAVVEGLARGRAPDAG